MFLSNFDITIVVDFSHKIDFIETEQTEEKVKFVLTQPLGEHVSMRKQRSGMNAKISALRSLADICFLYVLIRLIKCIIVSVCPLVF